MIVTNTTYQIAPWADVIFGMDRQWWKTYLSDVMLHCQGYRYSNNHVAGTRYAELKGCGNSGVGAIALAAQWGARRIILLGYDGQHTGGKKHWHGDHPSHLGNAGSVHLWQQKFAALAKNLTVEVINATRETALTCWSRMDLESALAMP